MYNKHLSIVKHPDDYGTRPTPLAHFGSRSYSVLACVLSCNTTLTDTMPNRFLVPALITGMILTVRITISF
jgi:hypothetical protein